ncbi:hypothetical protein AAG906_031222 [Vitis piasezkii]
MPQTKAAFLSASELLMLREAKLVGVGFITLLYARDLLGCGHPDPAYELEMPCCGDQLPLYSLTIDRLYRYEYPDELDTVVLMNCARPIFDHNYIPIVPCNRTNATFSSSQPYAYALAGDCKQVRDLSYSCTIGMTVVTSNFKAVSEPTAYGPSAFILSFCCHECEDNQTQPNAGLGLNKLINHVLVPVAEFFSKAFGLSFIVSQF